MSPRPGGRAVWNYNELEMQDDVAEPVTDEQILEDLEAVFCRVPISSSVCFPSPGGCRGRGVEG